MDGIVFGLKFMVMLVPGVFLWWLYRYLKKEMGQKRNTGQKAIWRRFILPTCAFVGMLLLHSNPSHEGAFSVFLLIILYSLALHKIIYRCIGNRLHEMISNREGSQYYIFWCLYAMLLSLCGGVILKVLPNWCGYLLCLFVAWDILVYFWRKITNIIKI